MQPEPIIPVQSTPIPVTPPIPIVPQPKSHKTLLIVTILLFVFFTTAVGAYLFGKSQTSSSVTAPVAELTPTPTATPTVDLTSDWQTYSNSQYGLSFRFPPTLNSDSCGISGPAKEGAISLLCLGDPNTIQPNSDKSFNGFAIYIQDLGTQTFRSYIDNEKKLQLGWADAMGGGQQNNATETNLLVGGKEAVVLQGYSWDSITRIYLELPNKKVLIIAKTEESNGSFALFDQILSTFKFTE